MRTLSGRGLGAPRSSSAGERAASASVPPSFAIPTSATRWAPRAWRPSCQTPETAGAGGDWRRPAGARPGSGPQPWGPGRTSGPIPSGGLPKGPAAAVKVLNDPVPAQFQESIRYAEQNLYAARSSWSVTVTRGRTSSRFSCVALTQPSRGPRQGIAVLIAPGQRLAEEVRPWRVGGGGRSRPWAAPSSPSTTPQPWPKLAAEKGAKSLPVPVACRRQLYDLSDDMATKLGHRVLPGRARRVAESTR